MILGKKLSGGIIALILLFGLNPSGYSGFLGYTQKPSMPEGIQTIYIDTIQNAIRADEIYAYEPGLEIEITNAIIRRLHRDGNLRVVPREKADAILEAKLIHFEQEGVRFSKIESVEEFRLYIILSMRLVNGKTNEVMWEEPHFSGNTEYFISQIRSIAREEATRVAIERLARNVVDRIVEDW